MRTPPARSGRRPAVALLAAAVVVGAVSCSSAPEAQTGSGPAGSSPAATTRPEGPDTPLSPVPTEGSAIPPRPSAGCDAATTVAVQGEATDETITAGGQERAYKRFVPPSYTGAEPVPLVVDLHGYSEGAAVHTAMSDLNGLAGQEGFVNLTPQGTGTIPFWNALSVDPASGGPDDVGFLADLLDATEASLCVDTARIYVTGLSNGAFMTSLVACELADRVAAVAPVAGVRFPEGCAPARPVPMVSFHGTADQFVTFDGSEGAKVGTLEFNEETRSVLGSITFAPIPDTVRQWAEVEGCASTPVEEQVTPSVRLVRYEGCGQGSVVELYVVDGGGHAWPGSEFSASIESVVGPTTMEIDANALMWAFFVAHPLPAG